MNILNKLDNINIENMTDNLEYMELQLCKEDYKVLKNIENKYNIAYDFQQKYIKECTELVMNNSTEEEIQIISEHDENCAKYMDSMMAGFVEHYYISRLPRVCNHMFLFQVDKYFSKKYNLFSEEHSKLTMKIPNISETNEKLTIKDILEYIRVNYNFIPPSN